tara:strand:+ start:31505 stop:32566 length:1062 start_codon:yes stop_codon:yes gene_type:complete
VERFEIDSFGSNDNIYLIPPYIENKENILKGWKEQDLSGHVFICSSGTTSQGEIKTYALSKRALLANASSVNQFLNIGSKKRWLASLPFYHVGGLSIFARSYLLNSEPVVLKEKWKDEDCQIDVNYLSVVPTQLYRIVKKSLRPPSSHEGIFVGGDFLATELRNQAIDLGWKVIATYGMTEVCSQLASSFVDKSFDGFLDILPIHTVSGGQVQSKSMFTSCMIFNSEGVRIEKASRRFILPDKIELSEDGLRLKPLGRNDGFFKYKGRLFSKFQILDQIQSFLIQENALEDAQVLLERDPELGERPILYVSKDNLKKTMEDHVAGSKVLKLLDLEVRKVDNVTSHSIGKIKNF